MNICQIQSRALIQHSLDDFGTPEQKETWECWASTHPDLNVYDAPLVVRLAVLETLQTRSNFLRRQIESPFLPKAEIDQLRSLIGLIAAIVEKVVPAY